MPRVPFETEFVLSATNAVMLKRCLDLETLKNVNEIRISTLLKKYSFLKCSLRPQELFQLVKNGFASSNIAPLAHHR